MRSKLPILVTILLMIVSVVGCRKLPGGVLSEKEMQKVMTDMLMAEAMINLNHKNYPNDTLKLEVYEAVFRKHKVTREEYDSSLVWYGENIDLFMKVYDRVIADYTTRIHDLGDIQPEAAPSTGRDSLNIWTRRSLIVLEPKAAFNGTTFEIKPQTNYPSGSAFVLEMDAWGIPGKMEYYPEINLNVVQRDTTIVLKRTITNDGNYRFVARSLPTRQVQRVYGHIRLNTQDSMYHKIYLDNIRLMRYNYGTDFETETETKTPPEEEESEIKDGE